ncbi:MAG: hypothetical protein WC501_02650 [Candidatus Micrarchaeia archaeon]
MMTFDIETGRINLYVLGPNGFIKRKNGKKIGIPSVETEAKLIEEFQKTKDHSKLDKFKSEYPKLMDGDTINSGKRTRIQINISYNKGKDKPNNDFKYRVSKTIFAGPNSELQLSGFEKWDVTNPKTKERHYGELVKNVFLKKGFFHVSYSHTEDPFTTPIASMTVKNGDGSGFFDIYEDVIYSCPMKSTSIGAIGMEYTNLLTKKSFLAKSNMPEEIIITKDAIYRRGLLQMDDIFQNNIQLIMSLQEVMTRAMPSIDPNDMANQMKDMGSTAEQNLAGLETLKQMSAEDLERLMKISEANGAKVTPEIMQKMKELPEMLKMMEEKGHMKDIKKSFGMMKGYAQGMGNANIERMAKMSSKSMEELKKKRNETTKINGVAIDEILEKPRKYKPLTKEFGAVKVG